jgi:hypothetical protein
MLSWAVDSLASAGEDSLTLRVSVCSFSVGERHQTQHRFYRLPQFLFGVDGPSLVCQGQIFHGEVGFGGDEFFLFWQSFQADRPEACGGLALFDSVRMGVVPAGKVMELMRIQTDDPVESAISPITVRYYAAYSCSLFRYEGVVRGLVSREDSAFSGHFWGLSAGRDFQIRRGHQVRLRVAVEGPAARARSGLQRLAPHPLLRRDTIAYLIEREASPLGDSLWIVPTTSRGNVERWRRMNNVRVSADVAASPEA